MHLLISHASAMSPACGSTLSHLNLPHLAALLARLGPAQTLGSDEYSLNPPHERALAQAFGWQGADGCLPWAAHHAAADGITVAELAWAELTPVHWHVGREQVSLVDPASLALDEAESRALFEAVRHLFESEGFVFAWVAADRWYAAHDSLAELPCASLDRVIHRNLDLWLQGDNSQRPQARLIRRLQNEVQMLLYPHALTEAREARGLRPVNSFWLSGCGRAQPEAAPPGLVIDNRLRGPLLADDWTAWAEAWQALDAGPLAELLHRLRRGESVALTLCGERHATRFQPVARSLWRRLASRWQAAEPAVVLEAL